MYNSYTQRKNENKKIVSNTIILFIRMIAIMVINLYAVRVILKGLGEEDYGIFNAVAGVVLTSTFISSTLANAIQRFYSFSLGKYDHKHLHTIFSAGINTTLALTFAIIIILESVGLWFIHTKMTIPIERLYAAEIIFHIAIGTFSLNILQIPFTAAVFAHEDMKIYTSVSTGECLGRFAVALLITHITFDHLIFYSTGLLFVSLCVFILYIIFTLKRYRLKYKFIRTKTVYKDLLSFSSYTMYGTIAGVGMIQGTSILLNMFFGPLANAAYSVSNQLYNAINALNNSIILAFRPVMIKSYASNAHNYLDKLFYVSNMFLLYAMLCIAIPAIFEMRTILQWWLGYNISIEMTTFSRLFIIYCVIIAMHNPITIIIQASGNIKYYYLFVETITIMCLPISWMLFKLGFPAYFTFFSMIGTGIVSHIIRVVCLKKNYSAFSYRKYIKMLIVSFVITISATSCCTLIQALPQGLYRVLLSFSISSIIIILLAFIIAINKSEKEIITSLIKQLFQRKK